jgi:hypothetical protein
MKQNSKRFASMILTLFFLVAALVIFFDLIQPAYGDLQQKKGQQISNQDLLNSEQQVVTQAKKLLSQYESESQAQASLALAMPSGPNIADAIAQIYGIAQNDGMTIQSTGISAPVVAPRNQAQSQGNGGANAPVSLTASEIVKPMGTIAFQLTAAGTYDNFKNFLMDLETNIRIFDVTGLSISTVAPQSGTSGASAAQGTFTYTLAVQTYYQLP